MICNSWRLSFVKPDAMIQDLISKFVSFVRTLATVALPADVPGNFLKQLELQGHTVIVDNEAGDGEVEVVLIVVLKSHLSGALGGPHGTRHRRGIIIHDDSQVGEHRGAAT